MNGKTNDSSVSLLLKVSEGGGGEKWMVVDVGRRGRGEGSLLGDT